MPIFDNLLVSERRTADRASVVVVVVVVVRRSIRGSGSGKKARADEGSHEEGNDAEYDGRYYDQLERLVAEPLAHSR